MTLINLNLRPSLVELVSTEFRVCVYINKSFDSVVKLTELLSSVARTCMRESLEKLFSCHGTCFTVRRWSRSVESEKQALLPVATVAANCAMIILSDHS